MHTLLRYANEPGRIGRSSRIGHSGRARPAVPAVTHRGYDHGRENRRQHQDRHAETRRQELSFPDLRRHHRPRGASTSASSTPRPASSPTTPASPRPAAANPRSPISTATQGVLLYRGYPIADLAEHGDFLETCYLLLYGELPTATPEGRLRRPRDPSHDGARADEPVLPGLPPRRPSDGGDGRLGRRAVGVLSRLHRHHRSAAAHDRLDPHDRQNADAGRDGLQIFDRPAVHVSEQQARLRLELPAHVLCGAVRGVQGQSGAGARHGPHLHPARRSRAERLDLDRAARRLDRRQSVRLHRRRHRLPVGPGAWRRQRGGAEDARRDRHRRPHSRIHQALEGPEGFIPPDGLRPSRLQELRSARQDHAEDLLRGA